MVHALDRVQVPVAPPHERLRVDVLVVLGEIQPAPQRLEHHASVVLGGQAELRLDGRAEQRTSELVEVLALHHDPVRRTLERLHVLGRDSQILQPQRLQRLEPEHVADDRARHVRDRPLLEQVEVVGDLRDVLAFATRHRRHVICLRLVLLVRGQPVGPDDRPSGGRRFAGDRGRRLHGIHAGLRRDPERGEDVGRLGDVVGVEVAHLGVRRDPGGPAVLLLGGGAAVVSAIVSADPFRSSADSVSRTRHRDQVLISRAHIKSSSM